MFKKLAAASALLVAVVSGSVIADEVYYVHSDHLNAPMVVTDQAKQVVWQGNRQPFGKTEVVVNTVSQPIRFPGQYEDVETGLHYNLMRDYHPKLGRYLQSDPIGLGGGLSTYGYVYQNPLVYIDPLGLATQISAGVSGTLQIGVPQLGFLGAGGGGGISFGVSIPDDWTDWRCYQAFASVQGNAFGGIGIFGGVGLTGGVSRSDGPISSSTSTGMVTEGNFGWGLAGGMSATAEGANVLRLKDWLKPITGMGGTIVPRVGAGFGLAAGVGQYTNTTFASPTAGDDCECS